MAVELTNKIAPKDQTTLKERINIGIALYKGLKNEIDCKIIQSIIN